MNLREMNYTVSKDIDNLLKERNCSLEELAIDLCDSSLDYKTLKDIKNNNIAKEKDLEKFYSFIYKKNYRIKRIKEEVLKEENPLVLFYTEHNREKENNIDNTQKNNSKRNFGKGLYLTDSYSASLLNVTTEEDISIFSYKVNIDGLKIAYFNKTLEWLLAISQYRGCIKEYEEHPIVKNIVKEIEEADLVIAPVIDNKMFHIITQFATIDINVDVALNTLNRLNFGKLYVFKTDKAIERLQTIERYYICEEEKIEEENKEIKRSYEIEDILKRAKIKHKSGLFIEEILK